MAMNVRLLLVTKWNYIVVGKGSDKSLYSVNPKTIVVINPGFFTILCSESLVLTGQFCPD